MRATAEVIATATLIVGIVREVMTQVLAQMEDMDTRLRKVERVISTLQQVAEVRAAMEAAA
jgi:hypothetical protein